MKFVLRLLLSALAVLLLANLMPGVEIKSFITALWVAVVLALLNSLVRPLLVLLTLPVTIITLGLFLLIINALIISIADYFIPGFRIDGFFFTLIFSILLSLLQSLLFAVLKEDKHPH